MRHTYWGADLIILLCLYCVLVCSKLDYGCIVYGLVHQSVLWQLDLIHHQGLHITLGAFHTSAQSLSMEANKPSLASHHWKLALDYVHKLKSLLKNPVYSHVFEPENTKLFENSTLKIPPLNICIQPHLEKSKINYWTSLLGHFHLWESILNYI